MKELHAHSHTLHIRMTAIVRSLLRAAGFLLTSLISSMGLALGPWLPPPDVKSAIMITYVLCNCCGFEETCERVVKPSQLHSHYSPYMCDDGGHQHHLHGARPAAWLHKDVTRQLRFRSLSLELCSLANPRVMTLSLLYVFTSRGCNKGPKARHIRRHNCNVHLQSC